MIVINEALRTGILTSGDAQKLAGRLNWTVQHLFNRLGRAMLRPIFRQKFSRSVQHILHVYRSYFDSSFERCGRVSAALRTVLKWWDVVLQWDLAESRAWEQPKHAPVHLFVDARGQPARCAAVLFIDGKCRYTDGQPSQKYRALLDKRQDNQIMSLEIMAVALGLSTFSEVLKGRKVVVYSDNTGAEACSFSVRCMPLSSCSHLFCRRR